MDSARWRRIEEIYQSAAERRPEERDAFLAAACGADEELRGEVDSLLAQQSVDTPLDPPAMDLAAGSRLGPYELLEPIGHGGMGAVFKARDTRLNRNVAIKVSTAQFSGRFANEARAVAALNHPNICTLYDVGPNYLVMELVEGADLAGPVPIDTAIGYSRQIAAGLEAAHEKGIIHRDLKPANIKVTPDGTIKILDFGLAKAAGPASPTPALTESGMILGTAAYMSPEQARGEHVDKRADIRAFGVVFYELLTGKRLFGDGKSVSDAIAAVLTREPDFNALPKGTPPRVRRLIEHCLRKDPKQRLHDIGDARILLQEPEHEATEPPHSRWRAFAGVAAAIAVVLGIGLWPIAPPQVLRTVRLTNDGQPKTPRLIADGTRVIYAAGFHADCGTDLLEVPVNGGAQRIIPMKIPGLSGEHCYAINGYSPATGKMMIEAGVGDGFRSRNWIVNLDGSSPADAGEFRTPANAWLSPKGDSYCAATPQGMYIQPLFAPPVTQIQDPARAGWCDWHPSGHQVTYLPREADVSRYRLKSFDIATNESTPLVEDDIPSGPGQYTSDGKRFFFRSGADIWVLEGRQWLGWLRSPVPQRVTSSGIFNNTPFTDPTNPTRLFTLVMLQRGEVLRYDRRASAWLPLRPDFSASNIEYSPDGEWMVYTTLPGGDLRCSRADGSEEVRLAPEHTAGLPSWSPDGSQIAFRGQRRNQNEEAMIWTVDSRGGELKARVQSRNGATWSPDGKKLVFGKGDPSANLSGLQIVIHDLVLGVDSTVPGSEGLFSPRWSPDGRMIAALDARKLGLSVFSFETQGWVKLAGGPFRDPDWSKDSKQIRGRLQNGTIVSFDLKAKRLRTIAPVTTFKAILGINGRTAWTKDGDPVVVAYSSEADH